MPKVKYNQCKYNEDRYNARYKGREYYQRSFRLVFLGTRIHGQIYKTLIFRARQGNGYFNSVLGRWYQDRYQYSTIPWPEGNPAAQNARDAMIAGNAAWKLLSAAEQKIYNDRASREARCSGRIIYLSEYITKNA